MASKIFSVTPLLVLPMLFQAVLAHHSAFEFIQHLQGCHKGDKVKDIHKLKTYLQHFGYLSYSNNQTHFGDDDFDEALESAIKNYQLNYNLKATGTTDPKTVSKMTSPRCAVVDIINGTIGIRSGKKRHHPAGSKSFHSVSHYALFPNNPRWPDTKSHLTYAFIPRTRSDAIIPVERAFQTWAVNTHFSFSPTQDYNNADLIISFESSDHANGNPFDGLDGTLAHAFAPTNGRFHYDADKNWSVDITPGAYHLEMVVLHEIGHLLGLHYSSVEGAIMFPTFTTGERKGLHGDDIQGIRAL